MFKTLKATVIAAGVLAATATMAAAITVTTGPVDLETPFKNPDATSTTGDVFENVTGTVAGIRRSPWDAVVAVDEDAADSWYTSVSANSSATYTISGPATSFSFIWGSPDFYNDLEIVLSGGATTEIIKGDDLRLGAAANTRTGAVLVTIAGGPFDSVTFKSGFLNAFEFANLELAPIPLPASLPLLLAGLGGVAFVRSRRKAS